MTDWLLDTDVVFELARPRPDGRVLAFLSNIDSAYVSVITLHELDFGRRRAPGTHPARRAKRIRSLGRI